MRRVLLIGCGGSGKSTLAVPLGKRLGLPVIHLDEHYWRPGWVEPPRDEWHRQVDELLAREAWLMDGNYGGTLERRMQACDTIVFLDRPRRVCLWHILKRRFDTGRRPGLAEGCSERETWAFLRWVWSYPRRHRPGVLELIERHRQTKRVFVLRTEREVQALLTEPLDC